jgi:hypothetical protein
MTTDKHVGSTFDSLLEEDGLLEETEAIAIKRVVAYQIEQAMQQQGLDKTQMAERMRTSRAQLNRLLDPSNASVTLHTMQRAAKTLGRRLRFELV